MKGKLVGRGGSAQVYEWGPDGVLKLFTPHAPDHPERDALERLADV